LKSIKKRFGIVLLPKQTTAYVQSIGELEAELVEKEIQGSILKQTLSVHHPSVTTTEMEIEELRKKVRDYEDGASTSEVGMNVFTPFSNVPTFSTEYSRRDSAVETQYKILQYTTMQSQQAAVEEQQNILLVEALDHAIPAEKNIRPLRFIILLGGMLIGLLSAIILSTFHYSWNREKNQNTTIYRLFFDVMNKPQTDITSVR
jgi:uncharacterized protein involved in exopolysaccharide biosynthesis